VERGRGKGERGEAREGREGWKEKEERIRAGWFVAADVEPV